VPLFIHQEYLDRFLRTVNWKKVEDILRVQDPSMHTSKLVSYSSSFVLLQLKKNCTRFR
jgi:hypothetical protein